MRRLITRFSLLAVCTVAALLGAASSVSASPSHAVAPHHPIHRITHASSLNWAGYDDVGGTYTSVSASWIQPAVTCSGGKSSYSSFWVGLDGDGSNSVEQTGTEADCSHGRASYSSWYEFYPAYPVNYSNAVSPGDSFSASVTYTGGTGYRLILTDNTKGWSHTTTGSAPGALNASAEVIAEAPSSNRGVLPLANFGSMTFSNAKANGSNLGSVPTTQPLTMVTTSGTVKCSVSGLGGGTTFTATWHHA
jgi:hypothetical protein